MEKMTICPNCGAENKCGGTCQHCGSQLQIDNSHNDIGDITDSQPHFLNEEKYHYFNETFDHIEKITQTRTNRISTVGSSAEIYYHLCREYSSNGIEQVFLVFQIPCSPYRIVDVIKTDFYQNSLSDTLTFALYQEKRGQIFGSHDYYQGNPSTLAIVLDKRYSIKPARIVKAKASSSESIELGIITRLKCEAWNVYYTLDKYLLHELCEVDDIGVPWNFDEETWVEFYIKDHKHSIKGLETRISFDDSQFVNLILPVLQRPARLLYNRMFDNSAYLETLTDFQKARKEAEKRAEQTEEIKKRQAEEQKKREEENQRKRVIEQEEWARRIEQYKLRGKIYLAGLLIGLALIIKGVIQLPWDFKFVGIGLLISALFSVLWLNWDDDKYKYQ